VTSTLVEPDCGGYATKFGLKCSDGRTITPEAFKHMDGKQIPLVWHHVHNNPENVLGYATLQHREDGMYASCFFNDTSAGKHTKALVEHGDVDCLSIYANQLIEKNKVVLHGELIEVSVVMKGANPGAKIDFVRVSHGDGDYEDLADEGVIYPGYDAGLDLGHAATATAATDTKTYQDVFNTLNPEQQELFEFMIKQALEDEPGPADTAEDKADVAATHSADDKHAKGEDDKKSDEDNKDESGDKDSSLKHSDKDGTMTRNVFENNNQQNGGGGVAQLERGGTLTHAQIETLHNDLIADAKKLGSFHEAFLQHAGTYGIDNIEVLFPDAKVIDDTPQFITRRMEWVEGVLNATRKIPWSKIRSISADLTYETARAKGYIKASMKKEQFFAVAKRETSPKTIYKKQRLDRDDITDITGFDVVAWLWVEMRFMLREEVARAILIGDGREIDDPDKIDEDKIRPIAYDDSFYTDVVDVPANVSAGDLVEAVLRARYTYKGTAPTAYMTNQVMVDMLLAKDGFNRRLYNTKADLASALGVVDIVEVPVMEGAMRDGAEIQMIIANLSDYAVGSTRGGEITPFDFFDIDYNQWKYLIETRMSGCLTKYKTAQVIVRGAGTSVTPTVPTFDNTSGVITIPSVTGVTYEVQIAGPLGAAGTVLSAGAQTALTTGQTQAIEAVPNTGYYFPHLTDATWSFTKS